MTGPLSTLKRPRSAEETTEPTLTVWERLDAKTWFWAATISVPVVLSALLLAPGLTLDRIPTGPELLGNPASENIKATHDLVVEDEAMSQRLREEAAAQVRRVYDYDAALAEKVRLRVLDAFGLMEAAMEGLVDENPAYAFPDRLSRGERADYEQALGGALRAKREAFADALEVSLGAGTFSAFEAVRYSEVAKNVLIATLNRVLSRQIIESRDKLEPDLESGITVQRVPDDGSESTVVSDLKQVLSLGQAKEQLGRSIVGEVQDLAPSASGAAVVVARKLVGPNLTLNRAATEVARERARQAVKPSQIFVKKGEMIIRDGERYRRRHLVILEAMRRTTDSSAVVQVVLGAATLVLMMGLVALRFIRHRRRRTLGSRDVLFLAVTYVGLVVTARLWFTIAVALAEQLSWIPLVAVLFLTPVAAGSMLVRMVLRVEYGLALGMMASLVLGMMVQSEPLFSVYALVGAVLGATTIQAISSRSDVLRASVWVGAGQAATALGVLLFSSQLSWAAVLVGVPAAFLGGLIAGVVTLAVTPAAEAVFGYTTDLKLLELANLNHPALKELIVQAPGSYHHSIIVGSLVEAAAESIGANPLLAKVMAYYHDLGKGCNAGYFVENQRRGNNPHNKLRPSMSAMIIRRHVTDGLEIAKRYGLGEQILAGIAEHHGTTLIQYFFARAQEQQKEGETLRESDYRYPGRKPQTRESALVMLGDSVEAAARSLANPSPARLRGLVNKVINMKFTDGQLEECDLTLKDLHVIARAFIDVLTPLYHQRVEYPELVRKNDGDTDPKPVPGPEDFDDSTEEDRPDNIRRLGLFGR